MKCSSNHYVSGDFCHLCGETLKEKKVPVKGIKKVSDKRAKEATEYTSKKKKFLKDNPYCQAKLLGCSGRSIDLHHAGSRGKNYLNESTFKAVCRNCHNVIHNVLSAKEARELKLKV
jgi:hypothetical protein